MTVTLVACAVGTPGSALQCDMGCKDIQWHQSEASRLRQEAQRLQQGASPSYLEFLLEEARLHEQKARQLSEGQ